MLMLALLLAAAPSAAQVENAREEGAFNCAAPDDMAADLKSEQYRRTRKVLRIAGYRVEVWKNRVPDSARRPDRDRIVYVRHTDREDCLIRTLEQ
jgi:hypothetical protein